ncbi:hypothetical protein [Hwangdonia lutea]|uniref:Uncharacterized protein n=1 Tax=Hwangdonia lutea TaxID=3075823 RepID=A0AA97ER82_9FLAO|nr:hypothetical protein [Hwangdonia sp. SCSIO 19198]WOD44740.1 hypothetical protein RNZ46_05625 [Hwangdonia sp. SCSIO 19198]
MTVFDQFYYSIFSFYKKRYKQKANTLALMYVSVLQISLVFLLGCFFAAFFNQLHADTMSSTSAWTLFIIGSIGIHFKNWIQYTGKRRMMINAKMIKKKKPQTNIWLLWVLPFVVLGLAYVVFQAV